MQIKDCMKRNIFFITPETTTAEAARLLSEKHIGSLPVVDSSGKLVGLLPLRSLLLIVMPDFINLIEDFDFVADFGAAEERKPDPALLARFPEGYRHLAYVQFKNGMTVKDDLPGLRGPMIEQVYAEGKAWLASASQGVPGTLNN